MNNIFSLDEWTLNKKMPAGKRFAFVKIYLKRPHSKTLAKIAIADRNAAINDHLKTNFEKLLNRKYFDAFELIGTTKQPNGVKAKVAFSTLFKLAKSSFVENIFIEKLDGAKKKTPRAIAYFHCVKMTVAIQVEGFNSGIQSFEERYVLVKATTVDNAYKRVKRQEKKYSEPYLNSDKRLVRWKIESYDDCFCTGINNLEDFNRPEGVEIFSKLGRRKITKDRTWDGKAE